MNLENSSGESARPIDAAGTALKFDIVIYLVGKGADASGTPLVHTCEKGGMDLVKALAHDVEQTGVSADDVLKGGKEFLWGVGETHRRRRDGFEVWHCCGALTTLF